VTLKATRLPLQRCGTNFYAHQGTIGCAKTETYTREGSLITYESIGFYHSSGSSSIWLYFLARRELRQDFG
jgi:hypothetical protein